MAKKNKDKVTLKILIGFKDKYTGDVYEVDKEYEFDEARATELLEDTRNLVCKVGD